MQNVVPDDLEPLPLDQWEVYTEGGTVLCIAMHTNKWGLYWTRLELTKPLEDFPGCDDLKSVFVNPVQAAPVA